MEGDAKSKFEEVSKLDRGSVLYQTWLTLTANWNWIMLANLFLKTICNNGTKAEHITPQTHQSPLMKELLRKFI